MPEQERTTFSHLIDARDDMRLVMDVDLSNDENPQVDFRICSQVPFFEARFTSYRQSRLLFRGMKIEGPLC